ncbi:unnamed protein product, partial [Meganyctiphanes norvegica]
MTSAVPARRSRRSPRFQTRHVHGAAGIALGPSQAPPLDYPTMRNVPNTHIISLALGDLLVVFFTVPFIGTIYTFSSWPFGEVVCTLQETVKDVSIGVTVFTLTALTVGRHPSWIGPSGKVPGTSTKGTEIFPIQVLIWVLSVLLALPGAVFSNVRTFPTSDGTKIFACSPFPESFGESYVKANIVAKLLIYYVVPLLVIGWFYMMMAKNLVRSADCIPGEAHQQRNYVKQVAARRKVAKMVLAFVVIFAVCFLPNHVFLMWFYFNPNSKQNFNQFWNVFRIVGFCLSFINSCINPLALYFISGTFRKYFNR